MDIKEANEIIQLVDMLKSNGLWGNLERFIENQKTDKMKQCIMSRRDTTERDELAGAYNALNGILIILENRYDEALAMLGANKDESSLVEAGEQA